LFSIHRFEVELSFRGCPQKIDINRRYYFQREISIQNR